MATLTVNKTYNDTELLYEADLDATVDSIKDFFNTEKIEGSNIISGGVDTGSIKSLSVTTAKIADSAVTSVKIQSEAVTAAKIGANQVTNAKIAGGAFTEGKFSDVLTEAKMAPSNIQISSAISGEHAGSINPVLSTSVTITLTQDRPILLAVIGSSSGSYLKILGSSTVTRAAGYIIVTNPEAADNIIISQQWAFLPAEAGGYLYVTPVGAVGITSPGVGTWTFQMGLIRNNTSTTLYGSNLRLVAMEL